MLSKKTLVALIRYNTVFEQEARKDEKTGLALLWSDFSFVDG
jgi:hypothetical protein